MKISEHYVIPDVTSEEVCCECYPLSPGNYFSHHLRIDRETDALAGIVSLWRSRGSLPLLVAGH